MMLASLRPVKLQGVEVYYILRITYYAGVSSNMLLPPVRRPRQGGGQTHGRTGSWQTADSHLLM